ncbi:MAG: hypothetical protein M1817_005327 [Caeruleum heppii]|nr:MAG: hypothetical protein M1817_005327 [Caeruleum heppii]
MSVHASSEKSILDPDLHSPRRIMPKRRLILGLLGLLASAYLISTGLVSFLRSYNHANHPSNVGSHRRVPLEAHIMSKCPDAKECLHDLVLPAMIQIADKVDFTLSYIGQTTEHDDGVSCMHGPSECLGNMLELCAATLYPDPKTYLGFTMCLTKDYQDIPDRALVEDCSLEHGINFARLNSCISEEGRGMGLLRGSVERTAAAGVTKSCTIRLNDKEDLVGVPTNLRRFKAAVILNLENLFY